MIVMMKTDMADAAISAIFAYEIVATCQFEENPAQFFLLKVSQSFMQITKLLLN
jgi:hypothetical protein